MRAPLLCRLVLSLALYAVAAAGCGRSRGTGPAETETAGPRDSVHADTLLRYERFPLVNADSLWALERRLGRERFAAVLKLNRIDLGHARQGDTLVVPSTFDRARLSPFPDTLDREWALRKLLLVSARVQAFAAYDSGRLARWGPTSTGRQEKPTPPGLYHTNWRQRRRTSTFDEQWILNWYVNLGNFDGISLHQYELPGRPASHSCVRLLEDDAVWLYDWVETWTLAPGDPSRVVRHGTPVVVLDEYAFEQGRPWKRLPDDPRATDVPADSIAGALRRWLPTAPDTAP